MEKVVSYILMSLTSAMLKQVKSEAEIPAKMREIAQLFEKHAKVMSATADMIERKTCHE
jgi:hypothetical protein